MRDLIDGRSKDEVWFCDGILTVLWEGAYLHAEEIHIHPEYDAPITLTYILNIFPTVKMVIFESAVYGDIYRYNNHRDGEWEKVGTTVGYA